MSAAAWIFGVLCVFFIGLTAWACDQRDDARRERDRAQSRVQFLEQCIEDHLQTIGGLYRDSDRRALTITVLR